ncbi:hypothetical protein LTR10_019314 [Elasticomyces elasticus]|uniref:Uncharacterized protein n=1 Tax=Exophiala sideris TaxID=1016849 RepID=A0ABR0J0Z3_9EURO|nr:hypothetical protein LTR10_019314 [Elasticomyces elasticus]KAK5024315.1 hypothetical protein LTS07_008606 [Exophiala sideris]KAK5031003.1 hypothetical protein LTR13_008016 [Exophiala sideris]KAK5054048.1 hypothetical protein LTR69_009010 [Exophiala sideris]KAK5179596.1 hypothetical protein LTR44_008112 [Eurotiomycetes sp. CCFEE 6388]
MARNPELQRVLAALNSYTAQPSQTPQTELPEQQLAYQLAPATTGSFLPGLGLLPAETQQRPITPPPLHRQQTSTPHQPLPKSRPTDVPSKPSTPTVPDASTIVTWPAALKHVTRHLVTNEQASARIKHLIAEQHKHERQWWAGREAILARQQGRSGKSQEVAALLKSLGGKEVAVAPSDPKTNQAELDVYDKKVYAGLVAMASDFDRQMRAIGVPFYAIKHDLVVLEEGPEKAGAPKDRVDKGELRELQKRMLQTLEDLFSD